MKKPSGALAGKIQSCLTGVTGEISTPTNKMVAYTKMSKCFSVTDKLSMTVCVLNHVNFMGAVSCQPLSYISVHIYIIYPLPSNVNGRVHFSFQFSVKCIREMPVFYDTQQPKLWIKIVLARVFPEDGNTIDKQPNKIVCTRQFM